MKLYLYLRPFRNVLLFSFFSLFSLSFAIYFFLIQRQEEDVAAFETLVKESSQLRSKRALEKQGAMEISSNVQKDFWTIKNRKETHIQLASETSLLHVCEQSKKLLAQETFSALAGWIEPPETERYRIEANEGFCLLPSFQFFAQTVKLTTDSTFSLEADKAHLKNLQEPLKLEGNIRFASLLWQEKPTYALAQEALYLPQKGLFILSGSAKKPVLCWQGGSSFAAPKLHIQQRKKTVQGIGDIRCSFDPEEQKTFQEVFSRYL